MTETSTTPKDATATRSAPPSEDVSTPNGTVSTDDNPSKPITMPAKRKEKLQQMLWHSLMECKGEIVAVTQTNGDTYSGILFAIEPPNGADASAPAATTDGAGGANDNSASTATISNAAWKYIVLKYVQKMEDPNQNPGDRIKVKFEEEMKIPAKDFASLCAINITDHTNTYRRSDRQAFNDATGRKLHRQHRELVRWEANDNEEELNTLENDDDLDDLRNGTYDQFKTNKTQFDIDATFDETLYTSNIDKNDPDFQRRLKEAQDEEHMIMAQGTDNKHVADDRAYFKQRNRSNDYRNNGDEDEEDAYSRVLHDASLSKQNLKDRKKKNAYVAPHLRKGVSPQNQNKSGNKEKHKQQQRRPPINKNQNTNHPQHNPLNVATNAQVQQPQQQQQQTLHSQKQQPKATQNVQNVAATQAVHNVQNTQAAIQQQLLQFQAQIAAANTNMNAANMAMPAHIAQIVQSLPKPFINPLVQQAQQRSNQQAQQVLANNAVNNQQPQTNATETNNTNINNANANANGNEVNPTAEGVQKATGDKDDGGALNPHAMEFRPNAVPQAKQNATTQQGNVALPGHPLAASQLHQQSLGAQLIQQQQVGQYHFNPATQQYVLNPFAQQSQQLQMQLQQQNQYLQQLAIQQAQVQQTQAQQQMQNAHGVQTAENLQHQQQQQQLLAHQQLLAQQHLLQPHQAQGTVLHIGAPLFTAQPNVLQQNQTTNQAQQHLLAQQQQAQFLQQQQLQQQQYLTQQFAQPQQQLFMQNLMPQ